ncbi:MAG: serine/threonine-protein kinase [Patescibacteria group bacterium]
MMKEEDIKELFRGYQRGRFEVKKILGVGGMGTVVSAFDTKLKVFRAIKMFNPELISEPEMMVRFENEASMMAGIDHPNIVKVFDIGEIDGNHFFILEWVDGGSLADHLAVFSGAPPRGMPPRQALEMIYCIAEVLKVAHALGIIHRDIKPDNVLVTKKGVPKVADFGIAHVGEKAVRLTGDQAMMGTRGYAPVEQLTEAGQVDARADIHAVGVTMWSLMTALHPPGLLFSHDIEEHPDLLDLIPPCLLGILKKSVAYRANDRYGSMQDFVDALKSAETELPPNPKDTPLIGYALDVKQYLKERQTEPGVTVLPTTKPDPTMIPQAIEATRVARAKAPISEPPPTSANSAQNAFRVVVDAEGDEASDTFSKRTMGYAKSIPAIPTLPQVKDEVRIASQVVPEKKSHAMKIALGIFAFGAIVLVFALFRPTVSEKPVTAIVPMVVQTPDVQNVLNHIETDAFVAIASDVSVIVEEEVSKDVFEIETVIEKDVKSKKFVGVPVVVRAGETIKLPEKLKAKIDPPKIDLVTVSVSLDVVPDDGARVYLVSAHGRFKLPTHVPPGTYKVIARFNAQDEEIVTIQNLEVQENTPCKIICNAAFANCKKR